jgi:short-subunit dehydrogenase
VRQIRERNVVITGASSGVGWAAAEAFAEQGANLVLVARRGQALAELAESCRQRGVEAIVETADVTDADALDDIAARTVERFGSLDVWVNNAAVMAFARVEHAPPEDTKRVVDVNVLGYLYGARAAIPRFREQGHGVIVNVGSILSHMGSPYIASYVASKWAVRGVSACLRMELIDAPGIDCCAVLPGAIDTPLFTHAANHTGRALKTLRPTYAPERVAAAVVSAARRPRREVFVGGMVKMQAFTQSLMPGLVERMAARVVEREHFKDWPAPPTSGNLHEPMPEGVGPDDGWRDGQPSSSGKRLALVGATAATAVAVGVAIRSRAAA